LFCIDEIQDTQDLQYAILSMIYSQSKNKPNLFLVGDANQAIYEGIGGVSKDLFQLNKEFKGSNLTSLNFSDNYRSTQRMVDYFSFFRNTDDIIAKAKYSESIGEIKLFNQCIHKESLAKEIAVLIESELNKGVPENEICIVAPQWAPIRDLSRNLLSLLPNVQFDAPSLSPFNGQHDNFWFIVTKIVLTTPSGRLYRTRMRWANEVIIILSDNFYMIDLLTAKKLLIVLNSFSTNTTNGTDYLFECFNYLIDKLGLTLDNANYLHESQVLFFEKALKNINLYEDQYKDDITVFRGFFKESTGVVINTCHGVKGEEYETVIALSLLKGIIPHWNIIYNQSKQYALDTESKLLYVTASRAKRNLYLISESGRQTKNRKPYMTADLLLNYKYEYD
jgi:DNA helicase-2/ATP-dependent DNA helicase PcrA